MTTEEKAAIEQQRDTIEAVAADTRRTLRLMAARLEAAEAERDALKAEKAARAEFDNGPIPTDELEPDTTVTVA